MRARPRHFATDGTSQMTSEACCDVEIFEPPPACSDGLDNDGDPGFSEAADLDGDGVISPADHVALIETLRRIARERFPNAMCGIIGIEPAPLIAFLLWQRTRVRRRSAIARSAVSDAPDDRHSSA